MQAPLQAMSLQAIAKRRWVLFAFVLLRNILWNALFGPPYVLSQVVTETWKKLKFPKKMTAP